MILAMVTGWIIGAGLAIGLVVILSLNGVSGTWFETAALAIGAMGGLIGMLVGGFYGTRERR